MVNEIIEKVKFAGHFLYQKILMHDKNEKPIILIPYTLNFLFENDGYYLSLKDCSNLSEEDIKHLSLEYATSFDEYGPTYDKGGCRNWYQDEIEYLRSKGYNVKYLDYSTEDLIDLGWIKIEQWKED